MSLIKVAISSAPARLVMQKTIANQAGSKAGALYAAASSRAANGAKDKVTKGLFSQLKATGVQRANPIQQVAHVDPANVKPLVTGLAGFKQKPQSLMAVK